MKNATRREVRAILLFPQLAGPEGGIQRINRDILSGIRDISPSHQLSVLLYNDTQETLETIELLDSIRWITCGNASGPIKKLNYFYRLLKEIATTRPDYLICGHPNFLPACYLARLFFNVPLIVWTYGIEIWNNISSWQKRAFSRAAATVVLSSYSRGRLLGQVSIPFDRVHIIPPTVKEYFTIRPRSPELIGKFNPAGKKVLLTACRLDTTEKNKGYDQVIRALPGIIKKVPQIRYILIGKGNDRGRIEKLIADYDLNDYVIMPGEVSNRDLPDYYNLADCFIMPSKKEGFGIVFIEASACGLPVIAGNRDGSVDAVQGGKTGLLIDPDSLEQISEAVVSILTGKAGRRFQDWKYLRKTTLDFFGFEAFKRRLRSLLDGFQ